MKDSRKLAEELLIKIYEPESKDCQAQKEDLQLAITLNPSVERIIDAMLSFHEQASKDMIEREFVKWACKGLLIIKRDHEMTMEGAYKFWKDNIQGK